MCPSSNEALKRKLRTILENETSDLSSIKRSYITLRQISDELEKNKESDGMVLLNQVDLYSLVQQAFGMNVIDLNSYCQGWTKEKGFLRHLPTYCRLFRPRSWKTMKASPINLINNDLSQSDFDRIIRELNEAKNRQYAEGIKVSITELFPAWDGKSNIQQKDMTELRARFFADVAILEEIRNNHFAHRYEKWLVERRSQVPQADFKLLDKVFADIEFVLVRVWHIVFDTSYSFPEYKENSNKTFIRDFVDLMRFGSIDAILRATGVAEVLEKEPENKYYWQYRRDRILMLPRRSKTE